MKRIKIAAGFICCLMFVFLACRKTKDNALPASALLPITVAEAQTHYLNKYADLIASQSVNGRNKGVKIVPQWDHFRVIKNIDGTSFLKVELSQYRFNKELLAYRDIVFKKERDGSIREIMVEVRVDTAYLSKKANSKHLWGFTIRGLIENKDFTGQVNLYTISNRRFIKGRKYENGHVTFDVIRKSSLARSSISASLRSDSDGGEEGINDDDIWDGGYNEDLDVVVTSTVPSDHGPSGGEWVMPVPDEITMPEDYEPIEYPIGDGGSAASSPPPSSSPKHTDNGKLSCRSFSFKAMTSNMYEAGISHLEFDMDIAGTGQTVKFPFRDIYVGFPSKTANGTTYTPDQAAAITAAAMNKAGTTLSVNYFATPLEVAELIPPSQIEAEFRALTQGYISAEINAGATVSANQSGTNTVTKEAVWNSFWDMVWNGLTGSGCGN